ncbi:MAG: sulfatase-like hydrolase/transferase [Pirellulaceae bacterium]
MKIEPLECRQLLAVDILGIAPDTGFSATDGITSSNAIAVHGQSEPDSLVRVHDETLGMLGEATADASGTWILNELPLLQEGSYSFSAASFDSQLEPLSISSPFLLLIDQQTPTAPAMDTPQRLSSQPGRFDFRLTGTTEPENIVFVFQDGIGLAGITQANASGQWELQVADAQLHESRFAFSSMAIDLAGNVGTSSESVLFRPNIFLVNTDDMRFDDVGYMPFLSSLVDVETITFENSFVPTSLSGPSRASLLTGLNAERTGVLENYAPYGGGPNFAPESTLPEWLDQAGYLTGLFGKDRTLPTDDATYPSQDVISVPAGWDTYFSYADNPGGYYFGRYTDGGAVLETGSQPEDYTTDVTATKLNEFVADRTSNEPFFAYFAPKAPHAPSIPAPRHNGVYADLQLPRPPSFNVPDPQVDLLTNSEIQLAETWHIQRAESLLSVDEAIANLYSILSDRGELDNTVMIFTSDNGILEGEHSLINKRFPYEEALRVPLFIWDGREPQQQVHDDIVLNIDLPLTIADYSGATTPENLDGQSLLPLIHGTPAAWREDFLIRHVRPGGVLTSYTVDEFGVRNSEWLYVERSDDTRLLFNLQNDEYQINNLAGNVDFADIESALAARLNELRPSDRMGPEVTFATITSTGSVLTDPQRLVVTAHVSDVGMGDSAIRTPELFLGAAGPEGTGLGMDAVDLRFDGVSEATYRTLQWSDIAVGSHGEVVIEGRDIIGNWGQQLTVNLPLGSAVRLAHSSDTGEFSDDRVTIDSQPTFDGEASSDAMVAVFASMVGSDNAVLLGTTVADSEGIWSIPSNVPLAEGVYAVHAQYLESGATELSFAAPITVHVLASVTSNGELRIAGTNDADDIFVITRADSSADVWFNDVFAGSVQGIGSVFVNAAGGDDTVELQGPVDGTLLGAAGNDLLIGGDGDDLLDGGLHDNRLNGRNGNDRYRVANINRGDVVRVTPTVDIIDEPFDSGYDLLDINVDTGVVGDLSASSATPELRIESPLLIDRLIRFGESTGPSAIERILGGKQTDAMTVPNVTRVVGRSGNDVVTMSDPILAGSSPDIRMFSVGLPVSASDEIFAILTTTNGTISVSPPSHLTEELAITNNGTASVTVQGPFSAVNGTFLTFGGVRYTPDIDAQGWHTIHLNTSPIADPGQTEQDEVVAYVVPRPTLVVRGTATYQENAAPVLLGPIADLTMATDGPTSARLTIQSIGFAEEGDLLLLRPQGNDVGQIGLDGDRILFEGQPIGTLIGSGALSDPLEIEFDPLTSAIQAQAVLRRLAFQHTTDAPVDTNRTIRFELTDSYGFSAPVRTKDVQVQPVNDRPTLIISGELQYTVGDTMPRLMVPGAVIKDPEGNFAGGSLEIWIDGFVESTDRIGIRNNGVGPGQVRQIGNDVFYEGVLVGTATPRASEFEPLRIQWNSQTTLAAVQAVVRRVFYATDSVTPDLTPRNIRFQVVDDLGTADLVRQKDVVFVN